MALSHSNALNQAMLTDPLLSLDEKKSDDIEEENNDHSELLGKLPLITNMLNDENHPLHRYIEDYVLHKIPYPTLNPHLKQGIQTAALLFGSLSGIPWAAPAYNLSAGPWGLFFAIDTTIVYGLGACWVWNRVLHDSLQKITLEEKEMRANTFCHRHVGFIVRQIASLANAITTTYTAYRFNTVKPLAVIAFVDTYAFSSLGFKYFFQGLGSIGSFFSMNPSLEREKKYFKFMLAQTFQNTLTMTPTQRDKFFIKVEENERIQQASSQYIFNLISQSALSSDAEIIPSDNTDANLKLYGKYFCYLLALAVVGISFTVDVILSDEGSEDYISHIVWLDIMLAILGNIPELALRIVTAIGTVNDIFAYNTSTIASVYYPITSKLLSVMALLLAMPTSAGPFNVISTVMSGVADAKYVFAGIAGFQEIIYETFFLRRLGYLFLDYIAGRSRNPEVDQLNQFSTELNTIEKIANSLSSNAITKQTHQANYYSLWKSIKTPTLSTQEESKNNQELRRTC